MQAELGVIGSGMSLLHLVPNAHSMIQLCFIGKGRDSIRIDEHACG